MPKKDRNALIGVVLLMLVFILIVIYVYFKTNSVSVAMDNEEIYEPIPFFDYFYSTFWSGYLNVPYMNRGWMGIATLISLCIIGLIIIKKMPAILQLTFLPTFYVGTYQFNGQDISHGYQIMSNDIALSGLVNMLFTLIWLMLWGGLAFFIAVILFFGFGGVLAGAGAIVQEQERAERKEQIQNLHNKKSHLESEKNSLITSNHILGFPVANLSPSELEHNRKKRDHLSKEIEEIEDNLKKFDDK